MAGQVQLRVYIALETGFPDHSSLDNEDDDTRVDIVASSESVDRPGPVPSDVVRESVEKRSGRGGDQE